jgi:excisionase family DNA binding protein
MVKKNETGTSAGLSLLDETVEVGAAVRPGLSRAALYSLMSQNKISYIQIGRRRRIVVESLNKYLESCLVPATA